MTVLEMELVANLASMYRNVGRWKKADELEVQVMETRKRVLCEDIFPVLLSGTSRSIRKCQS
jgi:hypothetical protein